jgi:hypothetical protein
LEVRRAEATFYRWKKTYAGLDIGELREMRQLHANLPAHM